MTIIVRRRNGQFDKLEGITTILEIGKEHQVIQYSFYRGRTKVASEVKAFVMLEIV